MVAEPMDETVEEEALPEGYCPECRQPLDSDAHKRGVDLHGHIYQLQSDADKQRRAIYKRAAEAAEAAQRAEARLMAEAAGFVVSEPKAAGK